MELNITRESVTSCEITYNQNVEQGIDFTVNIPDYCGAVQRILKYTVTPRISSKNINGQMLCIEGNACFNILYLDEDSDVSSYEYSTPFQKNIDIGISSADVMNVCIEAKCGYVNAKAVTPSRIDVHSVIELTVCVYKKKAHDIICDIDCKDIFISRGDAPATVPVNFAEKNMIIEEELLLESDMPSINCILRHDASAVVTGSKIVNDKVIAKGELKLEVLYCAEDKKSRQKYKTTVPFSQIVDVDGINDECKCDVSVDISSLEIKPRSAHDGLIHSFMLCAKLSINVKAFCNNDIAVIYDAYSKKYNTEISNCDTTFEKVINDIQELFVCKKNLEFSDGDVHNIIDLWCLTFSKGCRTEENNIIISGTVNVCLIAENIDGVINYFERPIDFEYRFLTGELPQNVKIEPNINTINSSYVSSGDNSLEIKIELSISASVIEIKTINILKSINVKEKENDNCYNGCSMFVYYACKGERVWDIAKHFSASPDDIMNVNKVSDVVCEDMPILISC